VILLLAAIGLAIAWQAFDYGRQRAGYDSAEAESIQQRLRARLEEVTRERHQLRDRVAVLDRSGQIDAEAARGAQEQIKVVQDQNLKLEQELAFLRSILKNDEAKSGIRVHGLKTERLQDDRTYGYDFVVSQLTKNKTKNNRTVTGKIYISVHGTKDGEPQEQSLAELTPEHTDGLKMRFKYFQNVTGEIRLPAGFSPHSFTVNVKPSGGDHPSVTQVFDWSPQG